MQFSWGSPVPAAGGYEQQCMLSASLLFDGAIPIGQSSRIGEKSMVYITRRSRQYGYRHVHTFQHSDLAPASGLGSFPVQRTAALSSGSVVYEENNCQLSLASSKSLIAKAYSVGVLLYPCSLLWCANESTSRCKRIKQPEQAPFQPGPSRCRDAGIHLT